MNNKALIAEARSHFSEPGYEADVDMIHRLADALERSEARKGVWAVVDYDNSYNDYASTVYAEEIEALREVNGRGYGRVVFLPWGVEVREAEKA